MEHEEEPSDELCGIDGLNTETITQAEFNTFVRRVRYYHMRPLKKDMSDIKEMLVEQNRTMRSHIESDRDFFNKLLGAKWALYAIIAILAPIVPLLYYLIKALTTAGVL